MIHGRCPAVVNGWLREIRRTRDWLLLGRLRNLANWRFRLGLAGRVRPKRPLKQ